MFRLLTAMLVLLGVASSAQAQGIVRPSFECARASTANERAICDSALLAWMDRQMATLYAAVRARDGDPAVEAQRAFHRGLQRCRGQAACLEREMLNRMDALARRLGAEGTGRYGWATVDGGAGGALYLVAHPGEAVALSLLTHNASHTCEVETEALMVNQGRIEIATEIGQPPCVLSLRREGRSMTVDGDICPWFCGMRATLNGTYTLTP